MASLVMSLVTVPVHASDQDIVDAGDALQILLPASGYLGTIIAKDKEGAIMLTKSLVTQGVVVWAGKQAAGKFRPQGTSTESYPSGHTAAAFTGASFLYTRYGRVYGIPAYALAAFTGYSRVVADAHHVDDVLSGMSVGLFSNWFWVSPHESRVVAYPSIYNDKYYLNLKISEDPGKKKKADRKDRGKYRYSLYFGPADQRNNIVRSPNSSSGTEFNLITFSERNDPTTTATVQFDARLTDASNLRFSIEPFEARDIGQFSQPVNFAGDTFPANTDTFSRYRLTDIRLLYNYNLLSQNNKWDFKIGGAISAQRTVVELSSTNDPPTNVGKVDDWAFLPLINAEAAYNIGNNMALIAESNWMSTSNDEHLDASLMFNYMFDRHWDAGIGYGEYKRRTDTAELLNSVKYNIVLLNVGYTF
jgi:hypothetical protein